MYVRQCASHPIPANPNLVVYADELTHLQLALTCSDIGRYAELRRAILDKNVRIPQNATVGHDPDADVHADGT